MPTQKFHEIPETYKNNLQSILEERYSIDRIYNDELTYVYSLLYPEDEKIFDDYLSLADYKRKVKAIAEKIGLEFIDFQEQPRKNFQIPYLYGLVIGSYFIKMAHATKIPLCSSFYIAVITYFFYSKDKNIFTT